MGDAPKTDRERRDMAVAIAKDVLERLAPDEGPALKMTQGYYVNGQLGLPIDVEKDLRDYADEVQANCKVCMLGAAMISKARLYDAVPMAAVRTMGVGTISCDRGATIDALSPYFDEATLDLIECAFECSPEIGAFGISDALRLAAAAFGSDYRDPSERAKAIMEKVVEGDGDFDLEPLTAFGSWRINMDGDLIDMDLRDDEDDDYDREDMDDDYED